MTKLVRAVENVRDVIHENCKDMSPSDFKAVLEELSCDIEGQLGALNEESDDAQDDAK
jgi:hypothetical protein